MKRNGFTLIELLAVIVILAIIALIATPIILGIINDAREKANERSIELYASAVRNGIAAYQLREGKEVKAGTYTSETLPFDVEYDGDVVCTTIELYEDGGVYVAGCKVNNLEVDYSYGTKQAACELVDKDNDGVASLSDIITCGTESFYVMSNKNDEITMLSMFNLYVGNSVDADSLETTSLVNSTVKQDSMAKGLVDGEPMYYGTIEFSTSTYWLDEYDNLLSQYSSKDPAWIYDSNSSLYQYVSAYEKNLKENLGVTSATSTLISYEQLEDLECSADEYSCSDAPEWVYSTSYWTGSSSGSSSSVWHVDAGGNYADDGYSYNVDCYSGVRPVITISTSDIQ